MGGMVLYNLYLLLVKGCRQPGYKVFNILPVGPKGKAEMGAKQYDSGYTRVTVDGCYIVKVGVGVVVNSVAVVVIPAEPFLPG
jgi:hypothetical protein